MVYGKFRTGQIFLGKNVFFQKKIKIHELLQIKPYKINTICCLIIF